MQIGNKEFQFDQTHTYIMGILNVRPDSLSDGGRFQKKDAALAHVEEMVEQGVDLVDVGGESTRPGYQKISIQEETDRVCQMIEAVKSRFDIPVSIDTYKAPVMEAALSAGADLANDIWGLRYEKFFGQRCQEDIWSGETMAQVIARHQVPVCIMHNRSTAEYQEFLAEMISDLEDSISIAESAGIKRSQMILDPGVGFAKSYEQNLQVLAHLDQFQKLELPLLLAASRKSVIGLTLDLPVDQREEGTLVTSILAGIHHWQMIRVHDVEKNRRAIQM